MNLYRLSNSARILSKVVKAFDDSYNELFLDTAQKSESLYGLLELAATDVFVRLESLGAAVRNVRAGKMSRTEGYPSIWPVEDGSYYLWDGHHRIADQWLSGLDSPFLLQTKAMPQYPYDVVPVGDKQFIIPLAKAFLRLK